MSKAIVFLADGCEECEALLVVDLLRRAGVTVLTAAVSKNGSQGSTEIVSSHNVRICADTTAEQAEYDDAELLVLPGGMPGTINLGGHPIVREQCLRFAENRRIAAICAAPSVLGSLGILTGKKATCYPGFEEKLTEAEATGEKVTVSGNITTGRALGAAMDFALELISQLEGKEAAEKVKRSICL